MTKKPCLFMSYAHPDARVANRIAKELSASGAFVWIDSQEMKMGDRIPQTLSEAILTKADFFIALLSESSLESKWVNWELNQAMTREIQSSPGFVLPIITGSLEVPPGMLTGVSHRRLWNPSRAEISQLAEEILASTQIRPRVPLRPTRGKKAHKALPKKQKTGTPDALATKVDEFLAKIARVQRLGRVLRKQPADLTEAPKTILETIGSDSAAILRCAQIDDWQKVKSLGLDGAVFEDINGFVKKNAPLDYLLAGDACQHKCKLPTVKDGKSQFTPAWGLWAPIRCRGSLWGAVAVFRNSQSNDGSFDVFDRNMLERAAEVIAEAVCQFPPQPSSAAPPTDNVPPSVQKGPVDVLLVTVTDVERDAMLDAVAKIKKAKPTTEFSGEHTYYHFGKVGGANVSMVKTVVMGSGPHGGSQDTILDAIPKLKPSNVIMVGIAFGIDRKKQEIGEILVSQQLQPYELQKVVTNKEGGVCVLPRGDKVTSAIRLLGRLNDAKMTWKGSNVDFGLVLSGNKLIDNIDYRDALLCLAPEAIGGEMEGEGLYAAARKHKVDWILVKAICDWADGKKKYKKKERQQLAASNAANFVVHALKLGGLAPDNA